MDKFRGTYRISSARAPWWDYGHDAAYFITICAREHYFGEIKAGQMILSDIGKIVNEEWEKTFQMRPDMNLGMGEYVVMPNHFHAIVIIGRNEYNSPASSKRKTDKGDDDGDRTYNMNQFGPQSKNLASIVRGFKSGVTKQARLLLPGFEWQSRYHDHIIRDSREFAIIENYIRNNPRNWDADKLNL